MKRYAIVIGNAHYHYGPSLYNSINDANDMAEIFTQLGFHVEKYLDVSKEQLNNILERYKRELNNYSAGVIYYAGHGMQIKGENYLVPVDCVFTSSDFAISCCCGVGRLLEDLNLYANKAKIMILDSCRTNPFGELRGDMRMGFGPCFHCPRGTFVSFSTSPNQSASDGEGKNGLFTGILKQYIMLPNLKIEDLFKRVRMEMIEASNNDQISWEHSCLVGDFYFAGQG